MQQSHLSSTFRPLPQMAEQKTTLPRQIRKASLKTSVASILIPRKQATLKAHTGLQSLMALATSRVAQTAESNLATVQKTIANLQGTSKPTLLCPAEHTVSKQEILAATPPKGVVDTLIAECFVHADVLHILLHAPTFQKQYENFWKQRQLTPIMWIGILYGLLAMGTQYEFYSTPASEQNRTPMLPIEAQHQYEMYRRKMI